MISNGNDPSANAQPVPSNSVRPLRILFVHKDFPGQFLHLAAALVQAGHEVRAICDARSPEPRTAIPGVALVRYLDRPVITATDPAARRFEASVLRGQIVARGAEALKQRGFNPSLVLAHPGWGEALHLKEIFPSATIIHLCEYYYHASGDDFGFDPEFPTSFEDYCRVRLLNAINLLSLEACDHGVSATGWQFSRHPTEFQSKINILHEGIDTNSARPNPAARVTLPNGQVLAPGDSVVTFVSRNLEPYRGFHRFMRALPALMARRPDVQVVVVGGDGVSYGSVLPDGETYRRRMLAELEGQLDPHRLHFLGRLERQDYLDVLAVSAAHVYLTYPFVLSWSMLEAMAAGCVVIGSATPPVAEVITHEQNGLLVDFFDTAALTATIERVLEQPDRMTGLRKRARATILERYDLATVTLPRWLALINRLAAEAA